MATTDAAPRKREAEVKWWNRQPHCGACRRVLGDGRQWRCPYVGCRKWLYGTDNPPPKEGKADHA